MGMRIPVKIVKAEEPWTTLELADGTTIKARLNVANVFRQDGVFNPNGDPVYDFDIHPTFSPTIPETLKRKQAAI